MYNEGNGIKQDDAKVLRVFRMSAEQGDAQAQFNLGRMYRVSRRRSCEGFSGAQSCLGCVLLGKAVPRQKQALK